MNRFFTHCEPKGCLACPKWYDLRCLFLPWWFSGTNESVVKHGGSPFTWRGVTFHFHELRVWEEEYIILQYWKQQNSTSFFSFLLFQLVFPKKNAKLSLRCKSWCLPFLPESWFRGTWPPEVDKQVIFQAPIFHEKGYNQLSPTSKYLIYHGHFGEDSFQTSLGNGASGFRHIWVFPKILVPPNHPF